MGIYKPIPPATDALKYIPLNEGPLVDLHELQLGVLLQSWVGQDLTPDVLCRPSGQVSISGLFAPLAQLAQGRWSTACPSGTPCTGCCQAK